MDKRKYSLDCVRSSWLIEYVNRTQYSLDDAYEYMRLLIEKVSNYGKRV